VSIRETTSVVCLSIYLSPWFAFVKRNGEGFSHFAHEDAHGAMVFSMQCAQSPSTHRPSPLVQRSAPVSWQTAPCLRFLRRHAERNTNSGLTRAPQVVMSTRPGCCPEITCQQLAVLQQRRWNGWMPKLSSSHALRFLRRQAESSQDNAFSRAYFSQGAAGDPNASKPRRVLRGPRGASRA
jgi:hypothetical protein